MLLLFLLCFTKDLIQRLVDFFCSVEWFLCSILCPWSRSGTLILEVAAEGTALNGFFSSTEYSQTINRNNSAMVPMSANFRWDHSFHHLTYCFVKVKICGDSGGNRWVPVEQVVYSPILSCHTQLSSGLLWDLGNAGSSSCSASFPPCGPRKRWSAANRQKFSWTDIGLGKVMLSCLLHLLH